MEKSEMENNELSTETAVNESKPKRKAKKTVRFEKYYFYCQPGTGEEQETTHQICAAFRKAGADAYIVMMDQSTECAPEYAVKYGNTIQNEMSVGPDVLFIVPEVCELAPFKELTSVKAVLWMAPAAHPGLTDGLDLLKEEKENGFTINFSASEYSDLFLRTWNMKSVRLGNYVPDEFVSTPVTEGRRGRTVLYNPADGGFANMLKTQYPDVVFIAANGMTDRYLIEMMDLSTVFLDLSPHRCDQRYERMAALRGMVTVSARLGSTLNQYDLPVDSTFKVDANVSCLEYVMDVIQHGLDKYKVTLRRFDKLRELAKSQKADLENRVLNFIRSK